MEHLYDILYFKIHSEFRTDDEYFFDAISRARNVDLGQIGLEYEFGYHLVEAIQVINIILKLDLIMKEFKQITTLRTPIDKLDCLAECFRIIGRETRRKGDFLILIIEKIVTMLCK